CPVLMGNNILHAQISNFENLLQSGSELVLPRVGKPSAKAVQNGFLFVQPRADDKWKTEFGAVRLVLFLEEGDFLARQAIQAGAGGTCSRRLAPPQSVGRSKGAGFMCARIEGRTGARPSRSSVDPVAGQ